MKLISCWLLHRLVPSLSSTWAKARPKWSSPWWSSIKSTIARSSSRESTSWVHFTARPRITISSSCQWRGSASTSFLSTSIARFKFLRETSTVCSMQFTCSRDPRLWWLIETAACRWSWKSARSTASRPDLLPTPLKNCLKISATRKTGGFLATSLSWTSTTKWTLSWLLKNHLCMQLELLLLCHLNFSDSNIAGRWLRSWSKNYTISC